MTALRHSSALPNGKATGGVKIADLYLFTSWER
jgi:hypothetical protein